MRRRFSSPFRSGSCSSLYEEYIQSNSGKNLIKKTRLYVLAVSHLVLSNEKKGLKALQKEMDFDEETTQIAIKVERDENYLFPQARGKSVELRLQQRFWSQFSFSFGERFSHGIDVFV